MQYHQTVVKVKFFITIQIVQPNPTWTQILPKLTKFVRVWGEIILFQIYKYCIYG